MPEFALDADAFNFLRALGLLDKLVELARETRICLHLTGFVARHELTALGPTIEAMENEKVLTVHSVKTKSPAYKLYRELQEDWDKGESETVAWLATDAPEGVIFVSCDVEVPTLCKKHKIRSVDIGELAVLLVTEGLLAQAIVNDLLIPWENQHAQMGRPKEWKSLAVALKKGS